jgi:hypothetical protein
VNPDIINQLDRIINNYWKDFYKVIKGIVSSGKVSDEQVETVIAENVPLLSEMNKCVKMYEVDAGKAGLKSDPSLAITINLAGKQRMLTQKMSKEFFIIDYGYRVSANKANLLTTSTLFDRTLKGLINGNISLKLTGTKNPAIRSQLEVVEGIWREFKPSIIFAISERTKEIYPAQVNTVAQKNLPLLKEMNIAVGMFEREAAK